MRVMAVVGTRPNFIKIDPILRAFARHGDHFQTTLVHTGQHYDERMSKVFFDDLGIRRPDVDLDVRSGTHGEQTAAILIGVEKLLLADRHDLLLVVGDVNSTVAAALAAAKVGVPIAHVEAGLRSGDRTMPEEINRLVTDAISDLLFTSSRDADENLRREGVPGDKVFFVGNVMIDTLLRCRERADRGRTLERLELRPSEYALLTLHRPANVDDRATLQGLLDAVDWLQQRLPVVFPAHPRTINQLERMDLMSRLIAMRSVRLLPPLSYLDFLALQARARLVLTDSGGVQEETTVLGVPCLTLRPTTERPVTVAEGTSTLVGSDRERIIAAAQTALARQRGTARVPERWDGRAAERIADVLLTDFGLRASDFRLQQE